MSTKMVDLAAIVAQGLADPSYVTWTKEADIYPALIEADKAILSIRPDVNTATKTITTVAGSRQTIADGDLRLLDVVCNLDGDDNELSDVIRMQQQNLPRSWRSFTKVDEIEGYLFDDRDPTVFETFPPINTGRKLRVKVSVPFDDYGTIDNNTESQLPQTYDIHKVEWALYRCMSRDNSPLASRADAHLRVFQAMLGVKATRDGQASPKAGHEKS